MGNRVQFTPPPKTLKQPTEADLAAVANGESLQLLETWQGSFAGSKLLKAGLLVASNHAACPTCGRIGPLLWFTFAHRLPVVAISAVQLHEPHSASANNA